jgi:hypothetical protein
MCLISTEHVAAGPRQLLTLQRRYNNKSIGTGSKVLGEKAGGVAHVDPSHTLYSTATYNINTTFSV